MACDGSKMTPESIDVGNLMGPGSRELDQPLARLTDPIRVRTGVESA
jgi:hypothetical protein